MGQIKKEAANLLVKIDGAEQIKATDKDSWKTLNGDMVVSLLLDQRLDCPDSFEVEFLASKEGQRTVFDWAKEGAVVELGFGYDKPVTALFKGEVVYCEVNYDTSSQEGQTVILRGYDHSHRLTRGHSAKTWGDGEKNEQVVSQVVSDVITTSESKKGNSSHGLAPDKVDDTVFKSRYIPKAMTTDYDFIKWAGSSLARASDSDQKDDKKISFRKLDAKASPVCTVFYDKREGDKPVECVRARFTVASYPSFAKVRVHGWNVSDKKAFVGEVETCSPELDFASANSGWTSGWKATGKALHGSDSSGAIYERVMEYCETKEEAEKVAQGIFDSFSLRYLTGEAEVIGCPDIVPGCIVEFKGFGDRVSGKLLVTQAVHRLDAKSKTPYTTTFQFCSNAAKAAK